MPAGSLLLSGACAGADETFAVEALRRSHGVVHFLGPEDEEWASEECKKSQSQYFYHLSNEVLLGSTCEAAFRRAATSRIMGSQRKEGWEAEVASMSARRNFFQVRLADAVYVVAWRYGERADPYGGKTQVPEGETPKLDVGGGTGWACQWYVDRFGTGPGKEDPSKCKLYLYDDGGPPWARTGAPTFKRWSSWDPVSQIWKALSSQPPAPAGAYAGIGGTGISEEARKAIAGLFQAKTAQADGLSGPNWETVKTYLKFRQAGLKDGTVKEELLALLDDNAQYHIDGVFSTSHYKDRQSIKKYLAEPAATRQPPEAEKAAYKPSMSADGKITVYEQVKKVGSWWKVKAVFTFNDKGKIVDIVAGRA